MTQPSIPDCQLDCANGGYCAFVSEDEDVLMHIFATGGMIQRCVCQPGFNGLACEKKVEQCLLPDLKCHNGAPCSPLPGLDNEYFCDCSYSDMVSNFAGAMCRNPATSYCGNGNIKSRSFCTNGGLCLTNLMPYLELVDHDNIVFETVNGDYSTHEGCQCPPEFEGEHCEYLKGMAPNSVEESNPVSLVSEHVKKSTELKLDTSTPNESSSLPSLLTPKLPSPELPSMTVMPPKPVSEDTSSGASGIFAVFLITVLSTFGAAMYIHKRRQMQMKVRQTKRIAFFGDDDKYKDETPIRVKIMSEIENEGGMNLDDLLGDLNDAEEEEEDMGSVSEMTLEEIELESDDKYLNEFL